MSLLLLMLSLLAVSCSRVPPGYVGIKVNLLGSEKGDVEELNTGRYWIGWNEELHNFPVFNQNYVWTADEQEGSQEDESFTFSVDGLTVNIDVGIEYNLEAGLVKDIFQKYRRGVEELTNITLRNTVRDGFNKYSKDYTMDELISGGMTELVTKVENYARETFTPNGINIISISLVSVPRYPPTVVQSIENKIKATQEAVQREYELRETQAMAKKEIAEAEGEAQALLIRTEAEAQAKKMMTNSYSPALLKAMWIEKWDGKLPQYMPGDANIMLGVQ